MQDDREWSFVEVFFYNEQVVDVTKNDYFFAEGREYDKKGNLNEWWDEKTIAKFKEKMTCFQEQYSGYHIENDHVSAIFFSGDKFLIDKYLFFNFRLMESKQWAKT